MGSTLSSYMNALPPLTDFFPPTPEAYCIVLNIFQYFPLFTTLQWLLSFHPAGKTSLKNSLLNIPGRFGWFVMEAIGPVNLIYTLWRLPTGTGSDFWSLPLASQLCAGLYVLHYVNRAVISPFFSAPSMSPIHLLVVGMAAIFNWMNSVCLAAWIFGYTAPVAGYRDSYFDANEVGGIPTFLSFIGLGLFFTGMIGNIHAERQLFQLRRDEADRRLAKREQSKNQGDSKNKYHKVYVIPPTQGVFRSILYPHYVFEWIEWLGFALVGTSVLPQRGFVPNSTPSLPLKVAPWLVPAVVFAEKLNIRLPLPAVVFFVNAVTNMLPHARWGRKWYVQSFGEKAVAGRGAVVPWCSWM
ncbi:hypothetical protein ASPZODRAFT_27341 [Penicilliopsis zonata CBS 506.65]|uniref:3-oxo-5-alpha-steroid 4-dehydrogenase C-terminal domain-containing protein n=1 Tax=Penicilliopsis zonata CBS 506.65 TaxID=1073090 RepID=A0A1L9SBV9_9EURO|nr:hypothetical protein ASPZODRAFT_27341 [Penicilliopsis zonata CBS 506.65]OJJ44695.1 hypothetical protein ASPZODRAFT_27341 [Penicilliopsis zonata CBS 506.65]